jgi:hypothetical protein
VSQEGFVEVAVIPLGPAIIPNIDAHHGDGGLLCLGHGMLLI